MMYVFLFDENIFYSRYSKCGSNISCNMCTRSEIRYKLNTIGMTGLQNARQFSLKSQELLNYYTYNLIVNVLFLIILLKF